MKNSTRLLSLLHLLVGGALVGLTVNLAKVAPDIGLAPLPFVAWSITGAAAILMLTALWRGGPPPISRRNVQYYAAAALVTVAAPNFIIFAAIPHVGAGLVGLILTLPPLLTYLGALVFRMERFQSVRATGVMAALMGAGVLTVSQLALPDANTFWILLVLMGPVLLAIGNLYRSLRWPSGVSPEALAQGMLVGAAVMLLLAGLLPGYSLSVPLDRSAPIILIVVQALVFAGQFQVLFLLQRSGGPVLLSLLGSVGAVVGLPVAIFLQNEAAPPGLLPGALLIAMGVALVTLGQSKGRVRKSVPVSQNQ